MKTKNYFKRVIIMTLIFSVTFGLFPMTSEAKVWMDPACMCGTCSLNWTGSEIQAKTTGRPYTGNLYQDPYTITVNLICYPKKNGNGSANWCMDASATNKKNKVNKKLSICLVNNHNYSSVASTKSWHCIYNKQGQLMYNYGTRSVPIICNKNKGY